MRRLNTLALFLNVLCWPVYSQAQAWSGILDSTRAIDWSTAGITGGIPARTTVCTNWYNGSGAPPSSTGNNGDYYFRTDVSHGSAEYKKSSGAWSATKNEFTVDVNGALNACASGDVVYLNAGTYYVNGNITVPGNVSLRGAGANLTILNANGNSGAVVTLGNGSGGPSASNSAAITSGATAGSTSIMVSSAAGISVGSYIMVTELNNPTNYVVDTGSEGACTWCDGSLWNGARDRGQIVQVESVNGNTIGISPGLYGSYDNPLPGWSANTAYPLNAFINPSTQPTHTYQQTVANSNAPYTCTSGSSAPRFPTNGGSISDGSCAWQDIGAGTTTQPLASPFGASAKYAGAENLQVYANNTGYTANFEIGACAYCWLSGVEGNYADGDHVDIDWSYFGEIVNSYFSNAFLHTPGNSDSDVDLRNKSTGMLVQNNILERLHTSIMLEWGAAGNVVAYNYALGAFDSGSPSAVLTDIVFHGAHPQYNLFEGNIIAATGPDNTWGSHANNTSFRQFIQGTNKGCNPISGRGVVTCTPTGQQGAVGINGWWEYQQARAVSPTYEAMNWNSVGNVVGSAAQTALLTNGGGQWGQPIPLINMAVAVCGPSPCGANSRSYDGNAFAYDVGYSESGDTGSSGMDTLAPYTSLLIHGDYSNVTSAVQWATGITHTLPASFYLSAKPTWWGTMPYPAIGPDVVGGTGPGGYAFPNPAEACYTSVMGGIDGTGSPLIFNASSCYGIAPPTNLTAVPK